MLMYACKEIVTFLASLKTYFPLTAIKVYIKGWLALDEGEDKEIWKHSKKV